MFFWIHVLSSVAISSINRALDNVHRTATISPGSRRRPCFTPTPWYATNATTKNSPPSHHQTYPAPSRQHPLRIKPSTPKPNRSSWPPDWLAAKPKPVKHPYSRFTRQRPISSSPGMRLSWEASWARKLGRPVTTTLSWCLVCSTGCCVLRWRMEICWVWAKRSIWTRWRSRWSAWRVCRINRWGLKRWRPCVIRFMWSIIGWVWRRAVKRMAGHRRPMWRGRSRWWRFWIRWTRNCWKSTLLVRKVPDAKWVQQWYKANYSSVSYILTKINVSFFVACLFGPCQKTRWCIIVAM